MSQDRQPPVPRPTTAPVGGTPVRDLELLEWARGVVDAVLLAAPGVSGITSG